MANRRYLRMSDIQGGSGLDGFSAEELASMGIFVQPYNAEEDLGDQEFLRQVLDQIERTEEWNVR